MYVILYFATTAATNRFEIWNNTLFSGIIPGDWLGNVSLVFHILLASVILFGGPLQFHAVYSQPIPHLSSVAGQVLPGISSFDKSHWRNNDH
jgi:hypothetical protein